MNVKKLIAILQTCDPSVEVKVSDGVTTEMDPQELRALCLDYRLDTIYLELNEVHWKDSTA